MCLLLTDCYISLIVVVGLQDLMHLMTLLVPLHRSSLREHARSSAATASSHSTDVSGADVVVIRPPQEGEKGGVGGQQQRPAFSAASTLAVSYDWWVTRQQTERR